MRFRWQSLFASGLAATLGASVASAQGLLLPNGGSIGGNMAGTSSAVGLDAVGAMFWNPAVISGLRQNEVSIGSNLIIPHVGVTGTIPAGTFGPLGPIDTITGRTNSDAGLVPTTAMAFVYRADDSRVSYGMSIASVAAGGVNFPGDANNPVLAPTGPLNQFILGPQAGSLSILSITPTMSYQVNDCLAVGGGAIIDVAAVSFDPAFFGPTSQANPLAPRQFPSGAHSRPFWGGGFRGGLTYRLTESVTTGVSYTSPQWFETWEFNARDANGNAQKFSTQFSLPQIFSAGVAYCGIERLLLAADLRWFDYSTTKLLGQSVPEGGAGWSSIWAVSLGANYQLTDRLSVQGGYLYNQNPIPGNLTLFNTQLPCITTNTLTLGAAYQINETITMSLGYARGFENTVSGTVFQAVGANTSVDSRYDAIVVGLNIKFGGGCRTRETCVSEPCTSCAATPIPASLGAPAQTLPPVKQ
ncbi:MAG: outer membrane protein transport protein [Gemmataceae bacterium]|nr:outer membrane protein transport protein [Gemmataceae bacterium]